MLDVDGGKKSGSGTILRLSVAFAVINQEPLHIFNIRQRRKKPGLRPQHLESVNAAAKLCNASMDGAHLGSRELWFYPNDIISGKINAEIGTAGSISMLLLTILPICAFARKKVEINVSKGGTDVNYSPTINYIKYVLLPSLEKMGIKASLTIKKFGYYPKGMGEVSLTVHPPSRLNPININKFGKLERIEGISVCTFLERQKVAQRQAQSAWELLKNQGYDSKIRVVNDRSNPFQRGSSLVLWIKTTGSALLGGDAIGKLRKSSEVVGEEAAKNLLKEIDVKATVDVHLSDMLIPYLSLANGSSSFLTRKITEHLDTNIWLSEKMLGRKINITKENQLFKIEM